MAEDPLQLDLTAKITEVPQANSLSLLIRMMEAIERGHTSVPELAEALDVEERTVHYYVDFGRWLKFLKSVSGGELGFTETGLAFATSVPGRGRLFSKALFARPLVQSVNALKRNSMNVEEGIEELDTRAACERAIRELTDLSASTAKRRASALASMLEAAYRSSRVDWQTGEPLTAYKNVTFDFPGRAFSTAMAARQFASSSEFRIGFPRQVRVFVQKKGHSLNSRHWSRASFDSSDNRATWFGAIPVTETTQDIAERGGRDLRKLLTMCAPYVTLAVAILTYRDAAKRPSVRLTNDMYGLKFWEHDRELGSPIEVVEAFAAELDLVPVKGVPRALRHATPELLEKGDDEQLVAILLESGMVAEKDTRFELVRWFEDELREGGDASPAMIERFGPLHEAIKQYLLKHRIEA